MKTTNQMHDDTSRAIAVAGIIADRLVADGVIQLSKRPRAASLITANICALIFAPQYEADQPSKPLIPSNEVLNAWNQTDWKG